MPVTEGLVLRISVVSSCLMKEPTRIIEKLNHLLTQVCGIPRSRRNECDCLNQNNLGI